MKILLYIDSLAGGGSQRQLANLAIGLRARGHAVTVQTYAPIEDHLPRIKAADVKYVCYPKRARFDPSPAIRLAETKVQQSPSIVIAFLRTPSIYAQLARLRKPGIPLIVSERAGLIDKQLRLSDKLASIFHLSASAIVANSNAYAEGMCTFFPYLRKRTHVIYNGVDDKFFEAGNTRIHNQSVSSSTDKAIRFCVVAARPGKEKGAVVLARAVALVHASGYRNFSVDWIGPADSIEPEVQCTDEIIKRHNLQGFWRWQGRKTNINECYGQYDASICPSLHEGVPNAICESMAGALPVIATLVGDNHLILDAPSQGLVCQPNNPQALAECIIRFLCLTPAKRMAMSECAYFKARELFSMKHYIDSWEATIRKFAKQEEC